MIFYQLWRFVTPGPSSTERRYALPFVVLSQVMFGRGLAFAYLVIPRVCGSCWPSPVRRWRCC